LSDKYKLYGFNNLTKTLNINFYNIYYACNTQTKRQYIQYINQEYSADKLTSVVTKVTKMIGANILNIAKQDYEPQGASVNLLISEGELPIIKVDDSCNRGELIPNTHHIVGHLDKSHVTVHTYPENNPYSNICIIRIDIEISTCGKISPLNAINYLMEKFDSEIITMDYKVRGFNRDINGRKHYLDHEIFSIQDFILEFNKQQYILEDYNLATQNMFYTKLKRNRIKLKKCLYYTNKQVLLAKEIKEIEAEIYTEIDEIYK
jgi:S-adenosylmethionine decarboxylase